MTTSVRSRVASLLALAAVVVINPLTAAEKESSQPDKDIVELARESGEFNMFLRLLAETDHLEKLKKEGTFTVFAPTDKAFDHLGMNLIDSLLHPSQKHYRNRLIGHHILEEIVRSDDSIGKGEQEVKTLAGTRVKYIAEHNRFFLETAALEKNDLEASNGVLHGIDRILVPRY